MTSASHMFAELSILTEGNAAGLHTSNSKSMQWRHRKHQPATYCFVACRELGNDRNQLAAWELSLTVQQPQQPPQQSQLMCHFGQCSSFGPVKSTIALLPEHVQMAN